MKPGQPAQNELPPLSCPACREPLFPRAEQAGLPINCHVCGEGVLVPAPPKKMRPRDEDSRTYGVRDDFELPEQAEYLLMICPLCGTRLHAYADQVGETLTCPDCHTPVEVKRGAAPPPKPPRTSREIGDYEVCSKETPQTRTEDYFLVKCFTCDARLHPRRDWVGKSIECPDCGRRMIVPKPPSPPVKKEMPKVEEMPVGAAVPLEQAPLRAPVQPEAIAYRIAAAELPDAPFTSGILSFPVRGEAFSRCGMLSFGLAATGFVAVFGMSLSGGGEGVGGMAAGVGMACFGLLTMMLGMGTFGFAAACLLSIVQETASGADEIVDWPEADWREWIYELMAFGFQLALALSASYGLALALDRIAGGFGLWFALASLALFPLLLLSSMAAESPFFPVSPAILKSLWHQTGAWLRFYMASNLTVAAALGPTLLVAWSSPLAAAVLSAPLLAYCWLIYARLIGRLGWQISLRKIDDQEPEIRLRGE